MPCSVKKLYASLWMGGHTRSAVVWKIVSLCIKWCIWRERNDRCFENSLGLVRNSSIFSFLLFSPGQWAGLPRG
jgi:hypothetical protein